MAAAKDLEVPPPENGLETVRVIFLNNDERNSERTLEVAAALDNRITTSKYTLLSFLPHNLLEQFMRAANFYFLCLLVLQLIPAISSLSPVTTAMPLVFVLGVTAAKDANDDLKRHRSDGTINNRATTVLREGSWIEVRWSQVVVGDIIKLKSNDFVPCDLVVLSTSEEDHDCYIETADLDGETNLKKRYSPTATSQLVDEHSLSSLAGQVRCDPPNNKLDKFDGTLYLDDPIPLSDENVLLRGCRLRNTSFIHGVAVYCGKDTKLMRNSGRARFKRTHIDMQLNGLVLQIFFVLFCMCTVMAILSSAWEARQGDEFKMFLNRQSDDATTIGTLQFFSYLIVLSNLVPISLYVSVELIRVGQSLLIGWDREMYHKDTDTRAVARTTTLNEELGQIDYVFSDKTGTLTQNVMRFIQCSIGGEIYGKEADIGKMKPADSHPLDLDQIEDPGEEETFIDAKFQAKLAENDPAVDNFFRLLALCHTVRHEHVDGTIEYQAQSPDEKALVEGARDAGFVFDTRTSEDIYISVRGQQEAYKMLNIIQFNSTRKRMTIVLQAADGTFTAYSKGADNVMEQLLSEEARQRDWPACEENLHEFAKDGLRTLVLCQRRLDPDWYQNWAARFAEAETSLEDRDDKIAEVAEDLERDFDLVGATAIEDRLQDQVPETIANMMRAGIKVWVLTGDKQETAINIGFSCRLLKSEMEPLIIVNGKDEQEVKDQLTRGLETVNQNDRPFALVVTGRALTFPLPPTKKERETEMIRLDNGSTSLRWTAERLEEQRQIQELFLAVTDKCRSVLCCRVSPLQKAQVVTLIKTERKSIALAIGDGANDVSMIKAAHIGVGISGLEGRQAVLASDFSIAQFRFLQRLLIVHGRWSYLRMSSFLNYFFYKNFAYAFVHFWFGFFCGYSAMTIYDAVFISTFNVIYSSLPILVVGILEQDVNDRESLANPHLYEAGPRNILFDRESFYWSLFRGVLHGVVIFFVPALAVRSGGSFGSDGVLRGDYFTLSFICALLLTWVVNLQLAVQTRHWTWLNWVTILVGPLSFFVFFGIEYAWDDELFWFQSPYYGVFNSGLSSRFCWAVFFLAIGLCMVASLLEFFTKAWFMPNPIDIVREQSKQQQLNDQQPRVSSPKNMSNASDLRCECSIQRMYDFSQEDNVGRSLFPRMPNILKKVPLFHRKEPPRVETLSQDTTSTVGTVDPSVEAGTTPPTVAPSSPRSVRTLRDNSVAPSEVSRASPTLSRSQQVAIDYI
ncbi:uncharacterized protein MONBRDRAFT_32498 [Monosiga brevicollis MX1]|uniref:Phospholipid-transporting ATPase n=1 Tax=Monosiga brevicollis TaxID=81824 RepID=A9V0N1_MONBE|nr:uncharacterized protein MONBRDRAFT_32498 [Monosiga brevicollis MX1]EDQ88909.1 predicted protein [Monosiga brevicollis MX1]|eukprot:XP_001746014.1 hypothetical protein [Monosiga brevicollis MX1]